MDLIDDPAESILTAVFEIPGIKTNDVSLRIIDGHLVVLGERRAPYNTTQRSEPLPQDTSESGISASQTVIPIQELRFGTFRRAIRVPEGLKVFSFPSYLSFGKWLTWSFRNQTSKLVSTKAC